MRRGERGKKKSEPVFTTPEGCSLPQLEFVKVKISVKESFEIVAVDLLVPEDDLILLPNMKETPPCRN
ncbi:MAG: hypothetical protein K8T20_04460 [Planctomycetes bacterium]|nr:hypothetical protein [Planctomycetota bacterium]